MEKYKKQLDDLKIALTIGRYCHGFLPDIDSIIDMLINKGQTDTEINIFYGETYDLYGVTIDSLKYYFFLSLLHKRLESAGLKVFSTIVVADAASILNPSAQKFKPDLIAECHKRLEIGNQIKEIYKLPINFVLMSKSLNNEKLKNTLLKIKDLADKEPKIKELLSKTVLQNRLKQEQKLGFRYALEAVATSLQFDIKIGPPREKFYDLSSQIITNKLDIRNLHSIYLKPTYPLGQNFAYYLNHPEIEEYGLTPYKAGSNQLHDYRIVLGKTDKSRINELIEKSFITSNSSLPNPVFDLFIISDFARKLLTEDYSLPVYNPSLLQDPKKLKEATTLNIQKYILNNFKT